jgi:hypothetical protein
MRSPAIVPNDPQTMQREPSRQVVCPQPGAAWVAGVSLGIFQRKGPKKSRDFLATCWELPILFREASSLLCRSSGSDIHSAGWRPCSGRKMARLTVRDDRTPRSPHNCSEASALEKHASVAPSKAGLSSSSAHRLEHGGAYLFVKRELINPLPLIQFLGNADQNPWSKLLTNVESEDVIRPSLPRQDAVGTCAP